MQCSRFKDYVNLILIDKNLNNSWTFKVFVKEEFAAFNDLFDLSHFQN